MRISNGLPDFTQDELERCWLSPLDVCDLAAIGEAKAPDVRRFLNNTSDRGFIPYVKSGDAKTSPRLYSCASAIALRTMREVTASGRSYEFASPVAKCTIDLARTFIEKYDEIVDIDGINYCIIYWSRWDGTLAAVKPVKFDVAKKIKFQNAFDYGLFLASDVIWNVLHNYSSYWERNMQARE